WLSLSVEKKVSTFLSVELSQEFRFYENISEVGTAFSQAEFQYKIFRELRMGGEYRFIQSKRLDDTYRIRHRYAFFIIYIFDLNRFSIRIREKFQSRYTQINSSEGGNIPKDILRSRLTVNYDLRKRYSPFVAGELYLQLNNPIGNEIEKLRYKAGIDYEVNKHHSLTLAYLIDKEVNQNKPRTDYVFDIGYNFSF
ncbi:MAG: DUF2490 domain-containing protein, partial [Bacteroidia bacterium]